MIVSREDGGLRLFTQPDHARLAADLLSLWRRDGLPNHPRREELLLAAREHDNGWQEADSAPRLDRQSSRPVDYRRLPNEPRFDIWRRGIDRLASQNEYAALLVAVHARSVHQDRAHEPWPEFLAEIDERRSALLEVTGTTEEQAADDYRFLQLFDRLSLSLCEGGDVRGTAHGYHFHALDRRLSLDPFPFAGATTFVVLSRRIPDHAYAGEAALGAELAAARWERTEVRVRPEFQGSRPAEAISDTSV